MSDIKLAVVRKKIEGELIDLMVRSRVDNIYLQDGKTTLAAYLATALDGYATENHVAQEIERLVDGAPEALDTLKELAEWIENHGDAYDGLVAAIEGKVDKAEGKGLSTEDFTTELKTKLEELSSGVDQITADMVTETMERQFVTEAERKKIGDSARVLVGETTPADLSEVDLFLQIVE